MSGLITQGMGEKNLIVTRGLGSWIEELIEVIERVVRYPIDRVPFEKKIRVIGDLSLPLKKRVVVLGDLLKKLKSQLEVVGIKDLGELLLILDDEEDEKGIDLVTKLQILDRLHKVLEKALLSKDEKKKKEVLKKIKELILI